MTSPEMDRLRAASNVLMLSTSLRSDADDLHRDLFGHQTLDSENVLLLTFGRADHLVEELRTEYDGEPNDISVIQIDETLQDSTSYPSDVTVRTVSPTDLTGVGMAVSDVIKRWSDDDAGIVVCFDSLTDFLQYADRSTMYRFLRVVTRRFDAVDGFAHFHMNPDAHDRQTIATLKSPFDAVVDASDESDVSVSTKY